MATPLMSLPYQEPDSSKFVVPWKSRKEFLKIYRDIFSDDESLQLSAVHRIRTWRSRVGSRLSVAVETTGSLVESIINHKVALRNHQVKVQESYLRSCYGLTVVRFVNHVTEKRQNKPTAQPIHSLAREFGIPEWIVRIRHNATHNVLPGLDMLGIAAAWALQYLKEEFWDNQSHDLSDDDKRCPSLIPAGWGLKTRMTLQSFYELRIKELRSKDTKQDTTSNEVELLNKYLIQNSNGFVKCLLEDGALISTSEQLEDFGYYQEDTANQPFLPHEVFEIWQPVISMLNKNLKIYDLAKGIMFSITDNDDDDDDGGGLGLRNSLLAGWLSFLLYNDWDSRRSQGKPGKKGWKKRQKSYKTCLPRKLLLSVCLDKINKYTIHLLKYLMDREELGDEAYQKLSDLLNISPLSDDIPCNDSQDEDEEELEEGNVYTIEDVKEASFSHGKDSSWQPVLQNVQASVSDKEIGWRVCTDVLDWSRVPFGVVPTLLEEEQDDKHEDVKQIDSSREDDGSGDDDGSDNGRTREWKKSQRKRPLEDKKEDIDGKRPHSKCSTYVVNDNELL